MFTVFVAIIFGSMSVGRAFAFAPDIAKARTTTASIMSLIERVPTIDTWSDTGKNVNIIDGHIKFANVHTFGCDKTTIINLIDRFYDITNGKIEIDAIVISGLNVCNLRENIALVSQEPSLYDMTIKENVIFGSLPDSYDAHVGEKGMQLSGGQKQRITNCKSTYSKS
ncbi:P-loop containing nucleoside triphosphate hydrolase protein [Gigaspora margarita]|uniref:P-loop containing nucleoside triphosphate hydrolase protein n=1 Tax=Gigaspora margarita TaxID=4874 RepID=A0A8H4A0H3_GIGMA|nr:P-loop containing nucleoside triphosphate hydrolase protein [Gigaspora margarita]